MGVTKSQIQLQCLLSFLDMTPKAQATKEKAILDFTKLNTSILKKKKNAAAVY